MRKATYTERNSLDDKRSEAARDEASKGFFHSSFDVDTLPQPFTKPVVQLVGRQDASAGYQDAWHILENYPRGTFAVLDRAGHNLQIEQPQVFNALIGEWLDRVQESRQLHSLNEIKRFV